MRSIRRFKTLLILAFLGLATHAAFAGQMLLVGAANGQSVEAYDGSTGQFIRFFTSGGPFVSGPSSLAIGPNGNLFMKGWSTSFTVLQYDGVTGAFLNTFASPTDGPASAILFGPDGNLYAEGPDRRIDRFNGVTGAFMGTFVPSGSGGMTAPEGMRFGPDGNLYVRNVNLLTGVFDVLRFNGTTGVFIDEFVSSSTGGLHAGADILFGPDGNLYVTDYEPYVGNATVRRYNGSTGAFMGVFADAFPSNVAPFGLAFGPDGNLYVSVMSAGVVDGVYRFDGTTGAFIDVFAHTTNANPSYILFVGVGICGDGTVDPGEQCDDGNTTAGDGCSATCRNENTPPDCDGAAASLPQLWAPDHKFVPITVVGVTDPDGDPLAITVTGVTQDEPLNGLGDGDTCPDATVHDDVAEVRAERAGPGSVPGNGRVYAISFTANDGRGGSCSGVVRVCVPHRSGSGASCIDDGQSVNSLGSCPRSSHTDIFFPDRNSTRPAGRGTERIEANR